MNVSLKTARMDAKNGMKEPSDACSENNFEDGLCDHGRISNGRDETEKASPRVAREYYLQVFANECEVGREDNASMFSQRGYGEVSLVILGL